MLQQEGVGSEALMGQLWSLQTDTGHSQAGGLLININPCQMPTTQCPITLFDSNQPNLVFFAKILTGNATKRHLFRSSETSTLWLRRCISRENT